MGKPGGMFVYKAECVALTALKKNEIKKYLFSLGVFCDVPGELQIPWLCVCVHLSWSGSLSERRFVG